MSASVQWTAVASILYFEIGLTILLVLPLLRPSSWKWIFSLRVFATIKPVWNTVYYALLLVLFVLFIDAIRAMVKYGEDLPDAANLQLSTKIERHFQECRGQRNFYITGFALFLILVIRRLITMLSERATLEASHEATVRQAEAANRELQRRIAEDERGDKKKGKEEGGVEEVDKTETKGPSQEEFEELQEELRKARTNLEAIKKQAESTNQEYDRLTEEHQKLEHRVQELESGQEEEEGKKDL